MRHASIDETSDAQARVGRTLHGKWRLDALIDVGGMADVYSATHLTGRRGAIKVLRPHVSSTPEVACAHLREAHPNTVRILEDDVDEDGNACVVMELLEGGTLRACALAEGGILAPDRVLRLLDQTLAGLAVLHEAGIVHRDIKPANLFLTTEGQLKIIDFGLASLRETTSEFFPVTLGGTVMGTPEFMSPEQAGGLWTMVNAQSDLWSLGATAFTLLSGEVVHSESTLPELLVAIIEGPAPSLSTVLAGAHPALVEVVDRTLEWTPSKRWSTARAMRTAVRLAFSVMYGRPLAHGKSGEAAPTRDQAPRGTLAYDRARTAAVGDLECPP
jgi:serine/threonine protein kinase